MVPIDPTVHVSVVAQPPLERSRPHGGLVPGSTWRLVIGYRDVQGNESVSRVFGLRDHHTLVWRVVGVVRDL